MQIVDSPQETICMKYQSLILWKKYHQFVAAESAQTVVKLNTTEKSENEVKI